MILISGSNIYKEIYNSDTEDFSLLSFDLDDSLIYHYGDRVSIQEDTSFENLLFAFINDKNSAAISKTLKNVTEQDNILSSFADQIKSSDYKQPVENIEYIEFFHSPIIRSDSDFSEPMLSTWDIYAWGTDSDDGSMVSFSTSHIPIQQLLEYPVYINNEVLIYDSEWQYESSIYTMPTVFDLIQSVCYEFCFYNINERISETNYNSQDQGIDISLNELMFNKDNKNL